MNFLIQPSRSTLWRAILAVTAAFSLLSILNLINLAAQLGVNISTSVSWLAGIGALGLLALLTLLGLAIGNSKAGEQFLVKIEALDQFNKWFGIALILVALAGFPLVSANPFFLRILHHEEWVRMLIFWLFSLAGMWGIRIFNKNVLWHVALIVFMLCQSVLQLVLINLPI
jgi:hypothetical protein